MRVAKAEAMKQAFDMRDFQSEVFVNKEGIAFTTKPHWAKFDEKHNASRSKAFMALYYWKYQKQKSEGLTVGQLYSETGVSYAYLKSRLIKWYAWKFIKREVVLLHGKPTFSYSLDVRGRNFVEKIIPKEWRDRYWNEMLRFKAQAP